MREAASGKNCFSRLRLSAFLVQSVAMSAPIVIAYHLVWTLYGWWLPTICAEAHQKRFAAMPCDNWVNCILVERKFNLPRATSKYFMIKRGFC
jgi:hypothetical protein